MAAFRSFVPPASRVLLVLALLVCRPMPFNAQPARPNVIGMDLSQLSKLLQSSFLTGPGIGEANSMFGKLFAGMNPLNAFGTRAPEPGKMRAANLMDMADFTRQAFQAINSAPVSAGWAPPALSAEMQTLLRQANEGGPDSAEAVATLSLLSAIFNLVSSILYTVSGGLGTAAASLSLIPAGLATITGPIGFALSADAFGSTLRSDFRTNQDRLLTSWTDALTALSDRLAEINSGNVQANLGGLRGQLAEAKDLLLAAAGKFSGPVNVEVSSP